MDSVKLFDINITVGGYENFIRESSSLKNSYSCFLNSHMIYEYFNTSGFSDVLNCSNYILPDGMPILYSIRFFTNIYQERIAGNDVIFSLFEIASNQDLKVFLMGSTDEVLKRISNKLNSRNIRHSYYSPPFLPIEEFDFEFQAKLINDEKPDLILVGLGCPKQEIWMYNMKNLVSAPMYGVGGAFLLFAGIDRRAPKIMRDLSLEWVYRLILEPKRLLKRYLVSNFFFIKKFIQEWFFQKK